METNELGKLQHNKAERDRSNIPELQQQRSSTLHDIGTSTENEIHSEFDLDCWKYFVCSHP